MSHILYTVHPDHGHIVPTVAVVRELIERGHRVSYLTGERTSSIVATAGASVHEYDSIYRDRNFARTAGDLEYLMSVLLEESELMVDAMSHMSASDIPDVVVYDASVLFCGRTLARMWNRPSVQLVPMFASNEHYSYLRSIGATETETQSATEPPNSDGPPPWFSPFLDRLRTFLERHEIADDPAGLWWEVPDRTVVTVPRSLQPAGETFDERFDFVGPCLGDRSYLGSWTPPTKPGPLVLVSCGAVFNDHPEVFTTCLEAFADTEWHVVATTGDALEHSMLGDIPPNVELHRWVPHLDVLAHADLVVTHGGMGTVLEASATGTPMIVVATSAMDRLTGKRISELGLGVELELENFDVPNLERALARVSTADYRRAATQMADDIRAAGGTAAAADRIESVARL